MLLNLVKELADIEDLENKISPTQVVYFDYLNLFLLTYSTSVAQIVDILIGLCAIITVLYYLWIVGYSKFILY
ncbi:hypothetical protein RR46_00051 [Papilio xuthus]|uniref:Uncharacterized protein n=1 Tax=Papilio xuthus TaxID=66420 RepID=A0A0N0PEW6_PAPXU|nr:hypothetical protein RR46_00051 [Papilio xuthus]